MTSDHKNMDINGFSDPKNIRKCLLLGDLEKLKNSKMATAAILKMVAYRIPPALLRDGLPPNFKFNI